MEKVPRILYVSDVPVELSFGGATLIFRLLEHYPKENLLIVQGMEINPSTRIKGVKYIVWKSVWLERLRITRLSNWLNWLSVIDNLLRARRLDNEVISFKPDLILTVSFRLMWLQAYKLSCSRNIPLHIILHDEWLMTENYGGLQSYLRRKFENMYVKAASRFCISQNMESYYFELFGKHGSVLFPMRGKNDFVFSVKNHVADHSDKRMKFCYAGTLYTSDYVEMLNEISKIIANRNGELHIFTNQSGETLRNYSYLDKSHVYFHGFQRSSDLVRILNDQMDVAILLNSFDLGEAFRYNFSSKLVDYTSAGLPILFWGPHTSGVISWAIDSNYGAVVTHRNGDALNGVLDKLMNSEIRSSLARDIVDLASEEFSYERNYNLFIRELCR